MSPTSHFAGRGSTWQSAPSVSHVVDPADTSRETYNKHADVQQVVREPIRDPAHVAPEDDALVLVAPRVGPQVLPNATTSVDVRRLACRRALHSSSFLMLEPPFNRRPSLSRTSAAGT